MFVGFRMPSIQSQPRVLLLCRRATLPHRLRSLRRRHRHRTQSPPRGRLLRNLPPSAFSMSGCTQKQPDLLRPIRPLDFLDLALSRRRKVVSRLHAPPARPRRRPRQALPERKRHPQGSQDTRKALTGVDRRLSPRIPRLRSGRREILRTLVRRGSPLMKSYFPDKNVHFLTAKRARPGVCRASPRFLFC